MDFIGIHPSSFLIINQNVYYKLIKNINIFRGLMYFTKNL